MLFLLRTAFRAKSKTNSPGPTHIILHALHIRGQFRCDQMPNMSQVQVQLGASAPQQTEYTYTMLATRMRLGLVLILLTWKYCVEEP